MQNARLNEGYFISILAARRGNKALRKECGRLSLTCVRLDINLLIHIAMKAYQQLETIHDESAKLEHLSAIVSWDEAVNMPSGGGQSRAKALAYLHQLKHQKLTSNEVTELLEQASGEELTNPLHRRNLALMKRNHDKIKAVPADLVSQLVETNILTEQAWRGMRADNNWQDFKPYLEKMVELVKETAAIKAQSLGMDKYDVLLDDFSPEINQTMIDPLFTQLKQTLPDLIETIIEKQAGLSLTSIKGHYPIDKQTKMAKSLMKTIGFDFNHGRLDVSHHPFCGGVADDVRITTRFDESDFVSAMMGVCHETGHAMYELGLPKERLNQPVGQAYGIAMHESQSLLIEMQVCRSRAFMQVIAKQLSDNFGSQSAFGVDNLYRHYTQVSKSYIRVDADEVTYPLHVILRYEIEQDLINDKISVSDLPDVWHEKMSTYLGLSTKGNYRDGVMQDVHWPCGAFGYFPSYTLGTLIAAQLFQAATEAGAVDDDAIANGDLTMLFQWLRRNIHHQASSKSFEQLLSDATGKVLSAEPFLHHVKTRYLG